MEFTKFVVALDFTSFGFCVGFGVIAKLEHREIWILHFAVALLPLTLGICNLMLLN